VAAAVKSITAFPAAGLMLAALAACGGSGGGNAGAAGNGANAAAIAQTDGAAAGSQLFADNFSGVCSGATVSTATAYDPAGTSHKALYFATYRDDLLDQSSHLPRDWTIQWSPNGDALRGIDLVVCARRSAAREVKMCDGYQSNGHATQNRVRWHSATYELSVHEAKTGRQLGMTSTVEATSQDCPSFVSFQSDSETIDMYAQPVDSAVADFLRPHMSH
jgi:hypothetical protein